MGINVKKIERKILKRIFNTKVIELNLDEIADRFIQFKEYHKVPKLTFEIYMKGYDKQYSTKIDNREYKII
jgi:hypothetical protein